MQISRDQVSLLKISIKRFYTNGMIKRDEYEHMLRLLDNIDNEFQEREKENQKQIIKNLNNNLYFNHA